MNITRQQSYLIIVSVAFKIFLMQFYPFGGQKGGRGGG